MSGAFFAQGLFVQKDTGVVSERTLETIHVTPHGVRIVEGALTEVGTPYAFLGISAAMENHRGAIEGNNSKSGVLH